MNADILFRLFGGLAIAITLYLLLPVLDLLEVAFYLVLGVIWAAVVVDLSFLAFGLIGSMGEGVVSWGQRGINSVREKASAVRDDLAARVQEHQATA